MIELVHGQEPIELRNFNQQNPNASPDDFDSLTFAPVKERVKTALHRDQGGLCAYCEQILNADEGQIDHIKPKKSTKPTQPSFPNLAFKYTNFAHSCINHRTCGQKKKSGVLPIDPAPHCNDYWMLSSVDGSIEPKANLTRKEKHHVIQTRDMLGLNISELKRDREKWFSQVIHIAREMPQELDDFLTRIPYRHILKTIFLIENP